MTTRKALCNIKGISEAKVEKIKEAALKVSGVREKITAEYSKYVLYIDTSVFK